MHRDLGGQGHRKFRRVSSTEQLTHKWLTSDHSHTTTLQRCPEDTHILSSSITSMFQPKASDPDSVGSSPSSEEPSAPAPSGLEEQPWKGEDGSGEDSNRKS